MRVKLFCAFRSRHPHPWLYTPLPIDTHLYFYHHPTAPTVGIVYDTIRLIISCLYATIDRTANCTRHSDSKTVAPRALLQPFRSQIRVFFPPFFRPARFFSRLLRARQAVRPVKLVPTGLSVGLLRPFVTLVLHERQYEQDIKSAMPRIRHRSVPDCGRPVCSRHRRHQRFQVYANE